MRSSRHSTASDDSRNATIVNLNSAPPSPKKIMGHGEQRVSSDDTRLKIGSVTTGSCRSSQPSSDEKHVSREQQGWPQLAEKMAKVPEFAAFSRFRDLNTKNLLFYQAHLQSLRLQILEMEEEETAKVNRYDHVADEEDSEYHQLLLKLRVLLQGYNKALVQYSRVSAMPDPESYNMSSLRRWLMRDDGANGKARGTDGPDTTWGDLKDTGVPDSLRMHFRTVVVALFLSKPPPKVDLDLVVTYPKSNIDGLSKWIVYNLTPFYWSWQRKRDKSRREQQQKGQQAIEETSHRGEDISIPSRMEEGTQQKNRRTEEESEPADRHTFGTMSESTALRFTSGLSTVVACLTPVIAIAVLAQVEGMRNLLLCITGFAVMFAILLIFLTQGTTSRTEIFAATAAFSAVLVVFISQPPINILMPPGTDRPASIV